MNALTCPTVPTLAHGEVAGSFLLGLVQSFYNLSTLPQGGLAFDLGEIDPEGWYPHALLIDTLHSIQKAIPASDSLFFRAGIHFLRIWYEHGPGKDLIHSSMDWLHANDESGGYNTVVRGGSKDEIGWCRVLSVDEAAGVAVIENVMPLPMEYVKGVFYGGCLIFDDLDYVRVEGTPLPYEGNPTFNKFHITVHFRLKPKGTVDNLDARIQALQADATAGLTPQEMQRLAWRYQWNRHQSALDSKYFHEINAVLSQATAEGQRISKALAASHAALERMAFYDTLTGLANRRLLEDRLKQALARANRDKTQFAVLFLDLDNFKTLNDTQGHEAGDVLLKEVAERLNVCVRESDTVARFGGDEFVVLAHGRQDGGQDSLQWLEVVAHKIIASLALPYQVFGMSHTCTCSAGASVFRGQPCTSSDLLKQADHAMFLAKGAGKSRFHVFQPCPSPTD
ncbi:MAG: GGDEF domain-containing protein [Hylemonella sp.]|nr:GGDEF domain-containing protein [Hylemonella sp.]